MIGVAEAFAVLFVGLFVGILTAVADVTIVGQAAFMAHFALWVLFNAIIAIHVDSRLKAIWWAAPFSLGYIEAYYLCTTASFEGYARSHMVTLAGMALVAPFLAYALWTAKRGRGVYGKFLAILIAAGVVAAGYYLYGTYDVFTIATAGILLLILFFWPARRLKFVPAEHPVTPVAEEVEQAQRESARTTSRATTRRNKKRRLLDIPNAEEDGGGSTTRRRERPTSRRSTRRRQDGIETRRSDRLRHEDDLGLGNDLDSRVNTFEDDGYSVEPRRTSERRRSSRTRDEGRDARPSRTSRRMRNETSVRPSPRPSTRRNRERRDEREREAHRRDAARRRTRRERDARDGRTPRSSGSYERGGYSSSISTLGTARSARPARRVR